ncbi:MAG: SWIM zinc finger family protein [Bacteroidota bacterium]
MFTLQQVQALSFPSTFGKGKVYFLEGAVGGVWQTGTRFEGRVKGQQWYEQTIDFAQAEASCTCPMGKHTKWCKHLVAVGIQMTTGEFATEPISKENWRNTQTLEDIKQSLAQSGVAGQSTPITPPSKPPVGLGALRWVLATFEAVGEGLIRDQGELAASWPPHLIQLRDQFLEAFQSSPPSLQRQKFCIDLWFHRWGHWEQGYSPDRPQTSLRYVPGFHQALLAGFQVDSVSTHYLQMKLEAFGLKEYI